MVEQEVTSTHNKEATTSNTTDFENNLNTVEQTT